MGDRDRGREDHRDRGRDDRRDGRDDRRDDRRDGRDDRRDDHRGSDRGRDNRRDRRPMQQQQDRPPNRSLFIRPIDPDTTSDDIMPHFVPYGDIRDIHIPVDFHTQKARGFAYIEFEEVADAEQAQKALQELIIGGKRLSVQFAFGDRKSKF